MTTPINIYPQVLENWYATPVQVEVITNISDPDYYTVTSTDFIFTIGTPQNTTDINNCVFPDVATGVAYITNYSWTPILAQLNSVTNIGKTFVQGNVVQMPEPYQSAINKSSPTPSTLTASLTTSTGNSGTQISATKFSTIKATVSTATTVNISTGAAATSVVVAEICSTNSTTAGDWTEVGRLESDQSVSLALALGLVQTSKGQICFDLPAGWYYKLRNSGTGTHSEAFVSGQKTIYG